MADAVTNEDARTPGSVQHFLGPVQGMPFLGNGIFTDADGGEISHQQRRLSFVQV